MKKILLMIFCLLPCMMQAHNLCHAIRNNDVEAVTEILRSKNISSADYPICIAASDESIHYWRESLLLFQIKPKFEPKYSLMGSVAFLGCLAGCLAAFYTKHEYVACALFLGSFVSLVAFSAKAANVCYKQLQEQYAKALTIQELIFQSAHSEQF